MSLINSLIYALRVIIIPTATILRMVFCLIKITYEEDNKTYKRRFVNAIIFLIISELVFVIKDIIENYYWPLLRLIYITIV